MFVVVVFCSLFVVGCCLVIACVVVVCCLSWLLLVLVVWCSFGDVCCSSFGFVGCWLLVVGRCSLRVACCVSLVAYCLSAVVCCSLCNVGWSLIVSRCVLFVVR